MANSRLQFRLLPNEVMQVQCHLTWIKDFIPHFERTVELTESIRDLKDYLGLLVSENLAKFGADCSSWDREEGQGTLAGESFRIPMGLIAANLNRAAFYAYLDNFQSARDSLEQVRKKVVEATAGKEKLQVDHRIGAVWYCVDAMELAMKMIEQFDATSVQFDATSVDNNNTDEARIRKVEEIVLELTRLKKEWKEIQACRESKACVAFLQGFLAGGLHVKRVEGFKKFEEAVELDPSCYISNHYAYRAIRFLRRTCRNVKNGLHVPDDQERRYCEKAYELRPDYIPIIIDYALLLKESMWVTDERQWRQEDVEECIRMFESAIQVAEDDQTGMGKFWLGKLKIYYGEFLVFRRHPSLNYDLGKRLFDESIEEYPTEPFVLHKVARFLHTIAYRGRERHGTQRRNRDLEKAEEYYQLALQKDWNFPCLIDYLKLLKEFGTYESIIFAMDEFPCTTRVDLDVVRVLVERGVIMWLYNLHPTSASKKEACLSWIEALVKYPDYAGHVYEAFRRPHKIGFPRPTRIPRPLVVSTLSQMQHSSNDDEEVEAISALVIELNRQEQEYEIRRSDSDNYHSNNSRRGRGAPMHHSGRGRSRNAAADS